MKKLLHPHSHLKIPKGARPKRLRFWADRKTMAVPIAGLPRRKPKQGHPDVIFWSFPEMQKLGALQVGDLVERKRYQNPIDFAFSEYRPGRMWVWRNMTTNAWWKGVAELVEHGRSEKAIGPRLQLRENPSLIGDAIGKRLDNHEVDYRLKAAVDLPATVELLAEHPDGRHVLIYGQGKFPGDEASQQGPGAWGFAWLRIDPIEDGAGKPSSDALKIVAQFRLPLVARSIRFTPEGQLLIGTAAGTVELYELP